MKRRAELSKDEEPPCGRKLGRLPVGIEPGTSPAGKVMEYFIPFHTLLPCVFFALLFFVSPVFSRLLAAMFHQAGTRGEEIFRLRVGAVEMRKPDG